MTYNEMIEMVKKAIRNGEKLYGRMMDIAIDLTLKEMEEEEEAQAKA